MSSDAGSDVSSDLSSDGGADARSDVSSDVRRDGPPSYNQLLRLERVSVGLRLFIILLL